MQTVGNLTLHDQREFKTYYFEMTPFRRVVTPTIDALVRFFSTRTVVGVENLPAEGPVIVAGNHQTNYDVIPMQLALPRPIFFMGKEELFRNPIMDAALRRMGGFPVYRGAGDEWAMNHARQVLDRGLVLGIFPEGTRSKGKGLRTAKTGAARLALEANCPVVPLAMDGPQRMFQEFPRRTPVQVTIGKPIFPEDDESPMELTDRIMFALADLLPEHLRGAYKDRPEGF